MRHLLILKRALLGGLAIAVTLPATGQDAPESLLPPGFGSPAQPSAQPSAPRQSPTGGSSAAGTASRSEGTTSESGGIQLGLPIGAVSDTASSEVDKEKTEEEKAREETQDRIRFDVPPGARRSLDQVGVIAAAEGGMAADAFGQRSGGYVLTLARHIGAPLVSRWGTIMTRRLLASRTLTPPGIAGQDWVAERSWLLLRMGEAPLARSLIQQVDASNYNKRLYQVAMPVYLANGDPAGTCPMIESANRAVSDNQWKAMRAVCASFAGEQGQATSFLNQTRYSGWVKGIDYLLMEKAVGAGAQGGRAVKIEWDNVSTISTWRHGLALTVGLLPPSNLYPPDARHLQGWLVSAPMLTVGDRIKAADEAAALGTLSNRAFVGLYSIAAIEGEADDPAAIDAATLETAYSGADSAERLEAMRKLWGRKGAANIGYSMDVLTARAAALLRPGDYASGDVDRIVASMLAAGFDRQAAGWSKLAEEGSLASALLAVGRPGSAVSASENLVQGFLDDDVSELRKKSQFLVAGLAGLGRLKKETAQAMATEVGVSIDRQSIWSREITKAAARGEQGTVVLLAAAGMQASKWQAIPARHLYYIVRALSAVGMEAEARMIAAEAVTRA